MTARVSQGFAVGQIAGLEKRIRKLRQQQVRTQDADRRLADASRTVLRTYQDIVRGRQPMINRLSNAQRQKLIDLAKEAFVYLGGQGDHSSVSVKEYDHRTFGPYLGVSDEGSAAQMIRDAAMQTPKTRLLKKVDPISVGVSLDAERLGAVGEVAVGPKEYAEIYLQSVGRILTSTNVGTRLNIRYYLNYPVVIVSEGSFQKSIDKAKNDLKEKFRPFLKTPDGNPRPITVYVKFEPKARRSVSDKIAILKKLTAYASADGIKNPKFHQLGLQQPIRYGFPGRNAALLAIDMAAKTGLRHVVIEGIERREAERSISYPGLLNYLSPELVGTILQHADRKGVYVHPVNMVDTETVARNVWSSLATARHMGLALGKYGTFPLTLEECDAVIGQLQAWFPDWTAAPVFFVDQGVLSRKRVFVGRDIMAGLKEWLDVVGRHGVKVVLIDTMEKSKGHRLLRTKDTPMGLLRPSQVQDIDKMAARRGIKTLWAGGITFPQVFEFGKLGVFGIYVTTAVATARPVSKAYRREPLLAAEKEPTFKGVYRAKLLLEAGFLSSRAECQRYKEHLERLAGLLISNITSNRAEPEIKESENRLDELAATAWTNDWKGKRKSG